MKEGLAVLIDKDFLYSLVFFFTYICYIGNEKPASTFKLSKRGLRKEEENSPPWGTGDAAGTVLDADAIEVSTLKFKEVNYPVSGLLN